MAEQIAYLPCPIISKELKEEILSLGYIAVDDDFAPDGYVLPPELQSIKQRIEDENAAIVAQAKQFNDALEALADSKRPASKQWVKNYIAEHGGGGGASYDDTAIKQRLDTAEEWIDALKLSTYKVIIDNVEVPAAIDGVGGRVNVQGEIQNLPDGYEVKALRSYSVGRATDSASNDQSWKQANFNMIGTAGGGKKGNLGILNNSSNPILVKITLEYNCGKIYPQTGA